MEFDEFVGCTRSARARGSSPEPTRKAGWSRLWSAAAHAAAVVWRGISRAGVGSEPTLGRAMGGATGPAARPVPGGFSPDTRHAAELHAGMW